jgi:hypothetical protein
MTTVVVVVLGVHRALDAAGLEHAVGGAIALGYAIAEPRGTQDVDVNVFVDAADCAIAFRALPNGVRWAQDDVDRAVRDGQIRLWWDRVPLDLFFDYHEIHADAAAHRRVVPFAGAEIPVLGPDELAVFKAFFDRPKDWVDIESMTRARSVDPAHLAAKIAGLLGDDDPRVARAAALPTTPEPDVPPRILDQR